MMNPRLQKSKRIPNLIPPLLFVAEKENKIKILLVNLINDDVCFTSPFNYSCHYTIYGSVEFYKILSIPLLERFTVAVIGISDMSPKAFPKIVDLLLL